MRKWESDDFWLQITAWQKACEDPFYPHWAIHCICLYAAFTVTMTWTMLLFTCFIAHILFKIHPHIYRLLNTHTYIHIYTLYEIFESFWQLDKWKALQVFFPWHSSHFWTTPSHIQKNNIDMKRFMLFFVGVVLVAFCWLQQFPQLREFEVLHASEGGTRKNKIDFLL